jgi:hypothetical protein
VRCWVQSPALPPSKKNLGIGYVSQRIEYLPSKCEALSSKKGKKKKETKKEKKRKKKGRKEEKRERNRNRNDSI